MLTLKLLYHLPKCCSPEAKMVEVLIPPGVPRSKYENIKISVSVSRLEGRRKVKSSSKEITINPGGIVEDCCAYV